jgi:hypothetical protein
MSSESLKVPRIDSGDIFTLDTLRRTLALKRHTLAREVRLRRLRFSKRAGKIYILGRWVLEWLEAGEQKQELEILERPPA